MYKKLRKTVADVITKDEGTEQFKWNRWLREPQIYLEKVTAQHVNIKLIDSYQVFPNPSLFQVKNFSLNKIKISNSISSTVVKKRKTHNIYFNFPKTLHNRIQLFDYNAARLVFILSFFNKNNETFLRTKINNEESVLNLTTECFQAIIPKTKVTTKSENVMLKKTICFQPDYHSLETQALIHEINLPGKLCTDNIYNIPLLPISKNIIFELQKFTRLVGNPKINQIQIISEKEIKQLLQESNLNKVLLVPILPLPNKIRLFSLKLTSIDKIRVQHQNVKNILLREAKIKHDRIKLLPEAEVLRQTHNYLSLLRTQIFNPGILNQLTLQDLRIPHQNSLNEEELKNIKGKKDAQKEKRPLEKNQATIKKIEHTAPLSCENQEKDFTALFNYQKVGIRFLLNHKYALLCDELGTKAKTQAACALISGIKTGEIKKALVITSAPNLGNRKVSDKIGESEGWENQIAILSSEIKYSTITLDTYENPPAEFEQSQIHFISYNVLLIKLANGTNSRLLSSVDCVLLDEAQHLITYENNLEHKFEFTNLKYLWLLSSYPHQTIEKKLLPLVGKYFSMFQNLDNTLSRSKTELIDDLPEIVRQDYWLEFDDDQKQEFENTITQGRKRLLDLYSRGNPFIIQSNIFTLLHQIKQIENFSTHNDFSPKAELLLEQIDTIIANNQKVIIFSQYDKQGTQKIERLLKDKNIRYVLYQSGMPLKELEKSVNSFKNETKHNVMVAGLTAASIKVKLAEAPYFIHFDQWWNPVNQWQYEDNVSNQNTANSPQNYLSVLNYFTNNEITLNLRKALRAKGLLNKNLIENLSNEIIYSLLSTEDWFDILGIDYPSQKKNPKSEINKVYKDICNMEHEQLGRVVKAVFTKFGYKNLLQKPDLHNNCSLIFATTMKGLTEIKTAIFCSPASSNDPEIIKSFLKESLKINNRSIVICSKELVNNLMSIHTDKINLINYEMLTTYVSLFKIM